MNSYYNGKDKLNPFEKVVTIVCLLNGVLPHWAERSDDLYRLVCGLTEMDEVDAKAAIRCAEEEGFIQHIHPSDQ